MPLLGLLLQLMFIVTSSGVHPGQYHSCKNIFEIDPPLFTSSKDIILRLHKPKLRSPTREEIYVHAPPNIILYLRTLLCGQQFHPTPVLV